MDTRRVPVLEVGGSHVVSALVELPSGAFEVAALLPLDSAGEEHEIVATLVQAARAAQDLRRAPALGPAQPAEPTEPAQPAPQPAEPTEPAQPAPQPAEPTEPAQPAPQPAEPTEPTSFREGSAHWGVALPGPFDYAAGVGLYEGVAKFEALRGVSLRAALGEQLPGCEFHFLNDADAFGMGEAFVGAARGVSRAVAIGIGTGIGSCFLVDGLPRTQGRGVPPGGEVHPLRVDGQPLEERCSARALRGLFEEATGRRLEVKEIAELALGGDATARAVFEESYGALARALSPWLLEFGTGVLVVGGAIARSWELIDQYLAAALCRQSPNLEVRPAAFPDNRAALVGAARHAAGPYLV